MAETINQHRADMRPLELRVTTCRVEYVVGYVEGTYVGFAHSFAECRPVSSARYIRLSICSRGVFRIFCNNSEGNVDYYTPYDSYSYVLRTAEYTLYSVHQKQNTPCTRSGNTLRRYVRVPILCILLIIYVYTYLYVRVCTLLCRSVCIINSSVVGLQPTALRELQERMVLHGYPPCK